MCWNVEASATMVVLGAGASVVTYRRGDARAIWLTLGFFTLMETLQVWGYLVVEKCGTSANRSVALASYLHITVQPFFINAFAFELVPPSVKRKVDFWVQCLCSFNSRHAGANPAIAIAIAIAGHMSTGQPTVCRALVHRIGRLAYCVGRALQRVVGAS